MSDPVDKAKLLGSLLLFTQVFYKHRTGRDFVLSTPVSRESHYITICRELTKVFNLETRFLLINVPPGHGKSELIIHFIAWAMAHYPDSAFLYISYSKDLAAKHTATIKTIMQHPIYAKYFGIKLRSDSKAKDYFKTTAGGVVAAYGSAGAITGQDGGLPNLERFSGGVFIDDIHKPDEVHSETLRENVKNNYSETIRQRLRGPNVPLVGIGQRLHEDDLFANLISGFDGYDWRKVILQAEDAADNVLAPNIKSKEELKIIKEFTPYVYASQYQQNPIPAGGGIFKRNAFVLVRDEPKIISTFITCDTAETNKTYNDATVLSFWGLYKIEIREADTGIYALHWIDCVEDRVEPKDLEDLFLGFYMRCLRHPVQPKIAAIEKKSTGVTLCSLLKGTPGLQIMEIERTRAGGSKTERFLRCQYYVNAGLISLPEYGDHTEKCLTHMEKITANETHRHDDICDTAADAIQLALIDKIIINMIGRDQSTQNVLNKMAAHVNRTNTARKNLWQGISDRTRIS